MSEKRGGEQTDGTNYFSRRPALFSDTGALMELKCVTKSQVHAALAALREAAKRLSKDYSGLHTCRRLNFATLKLSAHTHG